jgi:hypothetical protein
MEPRYVRHLAGYSAGHQLALLEGEGHLPMRSAPDRLAPLISDWLDELRLPDRRAELAVNPGCEGQSLASPRSWRSANCA